MVRSSPTDCLIFSLMSSSFISSIRLLFLLSGTGLSPLSPPLLCSGPLTSEMVGNVGRGVIGVPGC